MLDILFQLKQNKIISQGDYYFAKMIADKQNASSEVEKNLAILLAALCNYSHQQGNTCLFLDETLKHNLFNLHQSEFKDILHKIDDKIEHLSVSEWQTKLQRHNAFTSEPLTSISPLVFQFNALYFYRVWQDEYRVAEYLKSAVINSKILSDKLANNEVRSIIEENADSNQGQKIAIATALRQQFCLISGGPGTGKTYTVARLLVALQSLNQGKLLIKLAAPTGKAAARLTESIENALGSMVLPEQLRSSIPTEAMTIHRLLGGRHFKYHAQNPLPVDLLIVDEASMVDLSLMSSLLQALPKQARLILLGDKDQLASVEAGAILGELGQFLNQGYSSEHIQYLNVVTDAQLVDNHTEGNEIRDYLCYLTESRRFTNKSAIGILANSVNQRKAAESLALFEQYEQIEFINLEHDSEHKRKLSVFNVMNKAIEEYALYLREIETRSAKLTELTEADIEKIFAQFRKVRFLAALRMGDLGIESLNEMIAEQLRRKGLVNFKYSREWYQGKPVMIVQNDANVGLYNGDIGLFIHGKVWFELGEGKYKHILPSRVPSHEPAYVMTVHKSQGSEFAHTYLILPMEFNPVLTKELIYTAITRAKEQFTVFASKNIWQIAVKNQVKRQSGLSYLLAK
ncbi:exodeoxyribonuclease V subunit alpha [Pasteurella bettyae]|uniref:RecBCD enzyme subunit RecD n=1 Tax=Pasteurella bettyae CCUG 2042 TaxID=1095749 RepID=I3DIT0_9PAST|nr:exodeoxyribonuclease V subunit alpha [Pasteurella bettyae]EIJ71623.1 exodeoxyribonuclease V, alpha subunit [Pasteurella bettyae CCUG 2042]